MIWSVCLSVQLSVSLSICLSVYLSSCLSVSLSICLSIYLSSIYMSPWDFPAGSAVKNPPATRETRVRSLGREDPLEEEMATHSSTLAWRLPRMEEPGGLRSMGSQRRARLKRMSRHPRSCLPSIRLLSTSLSTSGHASLSSYTSHLSVSAVYPSSTYLHPLPKSLSRV